METIQTYFLPHWPFFMTAFILGGIGQTMKVNVWTKARAAKSKIVWYARATMAFHAAIAGGVLGALGVMPVSPGVEAEFAWLYHAGAGAAASWVFGAWKSFAKSRGITQEQVSMPPQPE